MGTFVGKEGGHLGRRLQRTNSFKSQEVHPKKAMEATSLQKTSISEILQKEGKEGGLLGRRLQQRTNSSTLHLGNESRLAPSTIGLQELNCPDLVALPSVPRLALNLIKNRPKTRITSDWLINKPQFQNIVLIGSHVNKTFP